MRHCRNAAQAAAGMLSPTNEEEFHPWQRAFESHGLRGLRAGTAEIANAYRGRERHKRDVHQALYKKIPISYSVSRLGTSYLRYV
jgi:hypothetical protein